MNDRQLELFRKALQRGVRRLSPHVAPTQRRALRALAGDVDMLIDAATTVAARVCTRCRHAEPSRGAAWCAEWLPVAGAGVELPCCDQACVYSEDP
jgi:hypothetical protein